MPQRILNVKVRPYRVAVLLGKNAPAPDVLLSLRFLSSLWGGRCCQLLAAEPDGDDPITCHRLSHSRPDLVYGVGIDHGAWEGRVREACQPRGYNALEDRYVENLHESIEGHLTAAHVIHALRRTPPVAGRQERTLRLVACEAGSPLRPFVAAVFGTNYEGLGGAIPHECERLPGAAGASDLVALHTDFISNGHRSWLHLASHGLSFGSTLSFSPPPPTIVLVGDLASDLALFWNLRQGAHFLLPPWLIPIPAVAVADPALPGRIKEWLRAWECAARSETCRVTSTSVPRAALADFAGRLQAEVEGTMVTRFRVWEPTNSLPVVVPFESEQQVTAELSRRALTFHPPRPRLLEGVSSGSWVIELIRDARSGRAVKGLCLPPRTSAFAVLNAPGPASIPMERFPRLGDGLDGINVRCSGQRDVVRITLPAGDEILEEALREAGINPVADEKRACYRPVMRMFGGLGRAAEGLSGQRGAVLRALLGGPLQMGEVQAKARLGRGNLTELAEPDVPGWLLDRMDPVTKRTFRRRRGRRWARLSPSSTAVGSLLEFWADRGIVSRQWRVGPCRACMGSFWEAALDIARPVACPGCGSRLRLPTQVPIGYSLHRLIGHAIREGVGPVVLTGRFLSNLTNRGFLWMPGVKYSWGEKKGDLDILACCDGHIAVGECKTLGDTPPDAGIWEVILEQFAETVKVGLACRASFVVLAVMAECFPPGFQHRVDDLTGPGMRGLLLTRQDLEQGRRAKKGEGDSIVGHLSLGDLNLAVGSMPERPRGHADEPGAIQTPLVTIT